MKILKVTKKDLADWMQLGVLFWTRRTQQEIRKEFNRILASKRDVSFICRTDDGQPVGFINIAVRVDYVEGSKTNPVGYLEGVYVKRAFRKKGVAHILFKEAMQWFANKKVSEIGSDTGPRNTASQKFHRSLGFKKYETLVHFIKKIS